MHKLKLEVDYRWGDKVIIISNPEEPVKALVTELKFSENEVQYLVSWGVDEKWCYAGELELLEAAKNEKQNKGNSPVR